MQCITILGSTGSIGTQALDVARKHNIKVKAVAAANSAQMLAQQAKELSVSVCKKALRFIIPDGASLISL